MSPTTAVPADVLADWWTPFADYLAKERRYSNYTLRNYRQAFADFYRWLQARGAWSRGFDALTPRDLRDWVIERQRGLDGLSALDRRTLHNHASALRAFFKFWIRHGRVRRNPLTGMPLPKLEKRLPQFLTEEQMKALLAGPQRLLENESIDPFVAWRDRLAMELLYGGGLRVSELVNLDHGDIDLTNGVARVLGKGRKERLCPAGPGRAGRREKIHSGICPRFRAARRGDGQSRPDAHDGPRSPIDVEALSGAGGTAAGPHAAQAAAQLRHAPAQRRGRPPARAGAPRPCEPEYDPDLHACERGAAEGYL